MGAAAKQTVKQFKYDIGGRTVTYLIEGDTFFGSDQVLVNQDDDLTKRAAWGDQGFVVQPFLAPADCRDLRNRFRDALDAIISDVISGYLMGRSLEQYHQVVDSDEKHLAVIERLKSGLLSTNFPFDLKKIESRISEICGISVSARDDPAYYVRIVRPNGRDNNPPHRDVWLDRLRNAIDTIFPSAAAMSFRHYR
jgi:hypothetical protein